MKATYIYIPAVIIAIIFLFLFVKRNSVLRKISFDLELAGIMFGGVVAVYSLILAFVVIVVWQQYQAAGDRIESETSSLFNVYRSTYAFKDSGNVVLKAYRSGADDSSNAIVAHNVRTEIDSYYNHVKDYEWHLMAKDEPDSVFSKKDSLTQTVVRKLWQDVRKLSPLTEGQKVWYEATIKNMYQFSGARHDRLANKDYHIPDLMSWMLILGAALVIIFSMFLTSNNILYHLVKVLIISVMIIFSLELVNIFNHPFSGILQLSSDPFNKDKILEGNW